MLALELLLHYFFSICKGLWKLNTVWQAMWHNGEAGIEIRSTSLNTTPGLQQGPRIPVFLPSTDRL